MPEETTISLSQVASEILLMLGHDPRAAGAGIVSIDALRKCTREQLIEYARRLGLSGVAKLNKDMLAGRIQSALDPSHRQPSNGGGGDGDRTRDDAPPEGSTESGLAPFPEKFDLGPDSQEEPTPHHIPWSYGQNRVTAMVVDPEKMFAYWECTDAAIETARRGLGGAGNDAWLNLRVYDVTGRLFDGTNAHSYFDHRVDRSDRQWFFFIGKPTSVVCVELGLKSAEGYFVKICRSGRVEFPRREPVGSNNVEWLTVNTASGYAGQPVAGGPPGGGNAGQFGGGTASQRGLHGVPDLGGAGAGGGGGAQVGPHAFERRWEWREVMGGGVTHAWTGEHTQVEWIGPLIRSAWEAGPFTYAIQSPAYIEEWSEGTMTVRKDQGQVHVVYGPWQVVIRGIGARAQRRVLGTWELRRQIAVTGGTERYATASGTIAPGSSEWMALGASERAWMGASEMLFGGASELWLLGASETRLGGSSELTFAGASELRMRGASERMFAGATERLFRGSSERIAGGASEQILAGASERMLGGGSERMSGASERLAGGSEGRLGVPSPSSAYPLPAYATDQAGTLGGFLEPPATTPLGEAQLRQRGSSREPTGD
jgi:hypothetical protein